MFLFFRQVSNFLTVPLSVPSVCGIDDPKVVTCALRLVSVDGECRGGKLEGGIVRNIESPIVMKVRAIARGEVAISDCEKIGHLFGAGKA
jgi:hypothetical protein